MKGIEVVGRETIKQSGILGAWFGPRFYISIADPVLAELILKTCLEKDELTKFTQDAIGHGSIYAPVKIWRRRRKMLASNFSKKILNSFVSSFARQSQVMADCLKPGDVPAWRHLSACTQDIVCETILGIDLKAQRNPHNPFSEGLTEGCQLIATRVCTPWLHSNLVYRNLPSFKRLKVLVEYLYTFIEDVISDKRKRIRELKDGNDDRNRTRSVLELMLVTSEGEGYTDLELQEETLTFMIAGNDTSASGAGFTLLMLARHQDVQLKVYDELKEVFGDSTRSLTAEDLPRLQYLDLVLKESLRLYPPAPVVLRKVEEDVKLPSGIVLPAGSGVLVNIWALHRNPEYWGADAEQFRPERFLTPLTHPAQFMPFSYGPRNCLGNHFAMLAMKTLLSTLLRTFRVLPPFCAGADHVPLRLTFDIMMKDVDNYMLTLEYRK
ncbi:cytochrome P450 4C1-like [Pectinophora gossypiella]|uniref:cytochrome P450 4C1-like n=1 Tax=Pectinophora gossypiella TaxID=13191 RepID=UPI00214EECB7|nr:cytochrome P450 4C1-like [Pectinophora gossypiella]